MFQVPKYRLERDEAGVVTAIPDMLKGWIQILELPQETSRGFYKAATDPLPFESNNIAKGSDNCFGIKDSLKQTYTAIYCERTMNANLVVERQLMAQDFWFGCKNLIEANRGGVMREKYKEFGRYEMLANRPDYLGIKWVSSSTMKGVQITGGNSPVDGVANNALFEHLRLYSENIWFIEIITQLKQFPAENTDIVSMMKVMELYEKNEVNLKKKNVLVAPKPRKRLVTYTDANGKRLQAWI